MKSNNKRLTLKLVHEKLNNLQSQVLTNKMPKGNNKNILKSSFSILYLLTKVRSTI